ncbi:MAG: hypothetical protein O2814_07430 [Bacteroidetes bacterium]|nr:hypothetical protein [Bacteroidota bacterium]MDA1224275.1 hypothetical protein [Bacteroidota bacterium]
MKNQIVSEYVKYCLKMGHAPANVFQLCEHLGIAETEFYHHFGSLEKVEESILLIRWQEVAEKFAQDSPVVKVELQTAFLEMTALLSRPFETQNFQFTHEFIDEIYAKGEEIYQLPEVKRPTQSRGSKHALYVNRTYFGIYSMMADLQAEISTHADLWSDKLKSHWGLEKA